MIREFFTGPWPWYVAGPLVGLTGPLLYLLSGRRWGVSSTLRDIVAATLPSDLEYFCYSWRNEGAWRLTMVFGLVIGGLIAGLMTTTGQPISAATQADLAAIGILSVDGLVPTEIFTWRGLATLPGFIMIIGGGFLVGFGARYANGCTSGHAISGLAAFRVTSLVAVLGFFVGGLLCTHLLLPLIMGVGF